MELDDADVPVIVEFNDDRDADLLIEEEGGRSQKRLQSMRGRTARMNKRMLRRLARHGAIKRVHYDRPVETLLGRTSATIGALTVQRQLGLTGAGIGVAVIDSGVTSNHDDLRYARQHGAARREVRRLRGHRRVGLRRLGPRHARGGHHRRQRLRQLRRAHRHGARRRPSSR